MLICIDGGRSVGAGSGRAWYRVGVRSGPWLLAERRPTAWRARPAGKRCAWRGRCDTTRRDVVWSARATVKVSRAARPPARRTGLPRKMTVDRYTSCHSLLSLSLTIDLHFFIFALPSAIAMPLLAGQLQGHWTLLVQRFPSYPPDLGVVNTGNGSVKQKLKSDVSPVCFSCVSTLCCLELNAIACF